MNRRILGIAVVGTLVVALLGTLSYIAKNRRAAARRIANPAAVAPPRVSAARSTADDLAARPRNNETLQHRRLRMMSNKAYRDDFKLSEQDVYQYVQAKGSNAVSLVTAFESTRNKEYLKAAVENFPKDPLVEAKALMWLDLSPEERSKMLDAFKESAPTNAFPNLLAAREAFKRGDTAAALAEIAAAKGKTYDEFDRESMQGLEEAYLSAGRTAAEAKTLGMAEVTLPQLVQFRELSHQLTDLAEKAGASGDSQTQQQLLTMNWEIGQKIRTGAGVLPIIEELVGISMQNGTLSKWPGGVDFDGRAASDVLAANVAARKELQSAAPAFDKWFPTAPDEEIVEYMDTIKTSGERQAMAMLKERHPELANLPPNN
jgi:hypothetical protein